MLINPTIDMLRELGLYGMATAFQELDAQSEARGLEHGEWLRRNAEMARCLAVTMPLIDIRNTLTQLKR